MSEWSCDKELFNLLKTELYTPVVGDILDQMKRYHSFLPQKIHPMRDSYCLVGRAMPSLMVDVHGEQDSPFGKLTDALDQIREGEVYLASGGNMRCAYWGEILTTAARRSGGVGAVINGFHRDTSRILEQDWPVFTRGRYGQDSMVRTKVIDYRCPIEVGKVWVEPGDIIFGDLDGVVVIPKKLEEEVITKSLEKSKEENIVRKEIENGMSSTEVFDKYGIL